VKYIFTATKIFHNPKSVEKIQACHIEDKIVKDINIIKYIYREKAYVIISVVNQYYNKINNFKYYYCCRIHAESK